MKTYQAIIEIRPRDNNDHNVKFETVRSLVTVEASSLHVAFNRVAQQFEREYGQMTTHYVSITVNVKPVRWAE